MSTTGVTSFTGSGPQTHSRSCTFTDVRLSCILLPYCCMACEAPPAIALHVYMPVILHGVAEKDTIFGTFPDTGSLQVFVSDLATFFKLSQIMGMILGFGLLGQPLRRRHLRFAWPAGPWSVLRSIPRCLNSPHGVGRTLVTLNPKPREQGGHFRS